MILVAAVKRLVQRRREGLMPYHRLTVRMDAVQVAWVDALADLYGCSRAGVVRESVSYLAAREHARVTRTRRILLIGLAAQQHDPVGDYLAGVR